MSDQYGGKNLPELLAICEERGLRMPAQASLIAVQNALRAHDSEQAKLNILRQVAGQLKVTLPPGLSRNEAEQLLGQAALQSLIATGLFVPGGDSPMRFMHYGHSCHTTGQQRVMAGHTEVSIRMSGVRPRQANRFAKALAIFMDTTPELKEAYFKRKRWVML